MTHIDTIEREADREETERRDRGRDRRGRQRESVLGRDIEIKRKIYPRQIERNRPTKR